MGPNNLPKFFGSGAAGTPQKVWSNFSKMVNKNRYFVYFVLLKSYFFGLSYEAHDTNFRATEKTENPHRNIYLRTEPDFRF